MNPNLHEVRRTEIHYLPACPCSDCEAERERRAAGTPSGTRIVPLRAARLFGIIPNPNPHGSLARQLQENQG